MHRYIIAIATAIVIASTSLAIDINLPTGCTEIVTTTNTWSRVIASDMDAKPIVAVDGTFSWALVSPAWIIAEDTMARKQIDAVADRDALVAAATAEGLDWSDIGTGGTGDWGLNTMLVVQRALVREVGIAAGMSGTTLDGWVSSVLADLRQ